MRLNLKAALESLLRSSQSKGERDDKQQPPSIVLLLREPKFMNLEQLRSAGERAFACPFVAEDSTDFCVFQKVLLTLMRVGPHVLSFMDYTKPYFGEESQAFGNAMPLPAQQVAWNQHTSWAAVNYAKGPADSDLRYAVLSKLCIEILDPNCVGAYVPRERLFIPHDGSLVPVLQRKASLLPSAARTSSQPN